MTNNIPQGSPGAASPAQYTGPSASMPPRRSSYASVAAGIAAATTQSQSPPIRSGAFSHLMNPTPLSSTRNQAQNLDAHRQNAQQSSERVGMGIDNIIPSSWGKAKSIHSQASRYSFGGRYGLSDDAFLSNTGFFKPSYLRESKYMEKLEAAHRAKLVSQREAASALASNPGSLSSSSSSVSLHRMAPSHRGMTYEIVEHPPQVEDDSIASLPSKWAEVDRYGGLEIAPDGLDVRYTGNHKVQEHEAAAARTDHPIPPQCGIYYYEVTIISKGKDGMIGVGFSGPKASLEKLPGWEPESWAYHGDDGKSFCCHSTGKSYGPTFGTGDVVGCGINFMTGSAFFTKNGVSQGIAFKDLKDVKLYPSVGMQRPGAQLKVNFGQQPFQFDIDSIMKEQREKVKTEYNSISAASLRPEHDEDTLIKELVAQFLAHDGFVETAKSFAAEIRSEAKALHNRSDSILRGFEIDDDKDAVNRQKIRAAILEGDIDKALKCTRAYYPYVLQDNHQINFRLRCRKFIEMMRQCAELRRQTPDKRSSKALSTNGHHHSHDDMFEQAMELDDHVSTGDDWDKMDTEEFDNGSKYEAKINETLLYGQDLKFEFKDDQRKEVKDSLQSIFAMFAYEDPWKSPAAALLEQSGRITVAEELNSAILVSLGKSPSAAIERLVQQTEVLVAEISEEGGAGAFVNVHNDFLR
ncbi:MAG: hypothetical protein MMC33_000283 [Icmadophila ericetorum]|nr:hypothetical protein [Icmadophila ericetorum]